MKKTHRWRMVEVYRKTQLGLFSKGNDHIAADESELSAKFRWAKRFDIPIDEIEYKEPEFLSAA